MDKIIKKIKNARKQHENQLQYKNQLQLEAGFSRLMQVMTGLVPSVETFAIITWGNPNGRPSD